MFVEIERFSSNLFMTQTMPGSRETNKHSKAISGVMLHLSAQRANSLLAELVLLILATLAAAPRTALSDSREVPNRRCGEPPGHATSKVLAVTPRKPAASHPDIRTSHDCR